MGRITTSCIEPISAIIPKIARMFDEPFATSTIRLTSGEMAADVVVVHNGDGDESLGYTR